MRVVVYKTIEDQEGSVIHTGYLVNPVGVSVPNYVEEESFIKLREIEGINYNHCMMLHYKLLGFEPYKPENIDLFNDDLVYCTETDRYGEVIGQDAESLYVEFADTQGSPVHLYDKDNWWHTLVEVEG